MVAVSQKCAQPPSPTPLILPKDLGRNWELMSLIQQARTEGNLIIS